MSANWDIQIHSLAYYLDQIEYEWNINIWYMPRNTDTVAIYTLNTLNVFVVIHWAFIVLKICSLLMDLQRSVFDSSIWQFYDYSDF